MQTQQYNNTITRLSQLQCLKTLIKHYPTKKVIKNTIQFENLHMQQPNTTKSTKEEHLSSQECSCHTKAINSKLCSSSSVRNNDDFLKQL